MSIQDLENEHILVETWRAFNTKVENYDNHREMLSSQIVAIKELENYDTIASEEEKAMVTEYEAKIAENIVEEK